MPSFKGYPTEIVQVERTRNRTNIGVIRVHSARKHKDEFDRKACVCKLARGSGMYYYVWFVVFLVLPKRIHFFITNKPIFKRKPY